MITGSCRDEGDLGFVCFIILADFIRRPELVFLEDRERLRATITSLKVPERKVGSPLAVDAPPALSTQARGYHGVGEVAFAASSPFFRGHGPRISPPPMNSP